MTVFIGCDIGSVTVKAALFGNAAELLSAKVAWPPYSGSFPEELTGSLFVSPLLPVLGNPVAAAHALLSEITNLLPAGAEVVVAFTGANGRIAAQQLSTAYISDYRALVAGVAARYPHAQSIIEIGATRSSFLQLQQGEVAGTQVLCDYSTNGACAAGSGSFLDQQAQRLGLEITELAEMAAAAVCSNAIAGRCSVFARSDMIHAQQKGAAPDEILRGLCEALARSYAATVLKGRTPGSQAVFVGGVAQNGAVVNALRESIGLTEQALVVPPHCSHYPAIGVALLQYKAANQPHNSASRPETIPLSSTPAHGSCPALTLQNVQILKAEEVYIPVSGELHVHLGIDIGSVSTNLVCTDRDGVLLREIYLRTQGRPLQVVAQGLAQLYDEFGERLIVLGVGTTGSGRELIGELLGADTINDEITAHTVGAGRIAGSCLKRQVETILEIGGQDAKFIRLENGIVVDFAMNEACSAGTGSFLEEQAERLGVDICGEFSRLALTAEHPLRLGERCTVFMEQDVTDSLGRGESRANLSAGVAYAVVHNYLNRVKGGRPVGETIFFQGGTAYNHAVAAAFAQVLGKRVIIPPHNGVMGAYGAALLARDKMLTSGGKTAFRGFTSPLDDCQRREFTCAACSNNCTIQEFSRDGRASYWGDKCAVRFRHRAPSDAQPVIEDLCLLRERELYRDYHSEFLKGAYGDNLRRDAARAEEWADRKGTSLRVAMARSLYHFDFHPFWNSYLASLGMTVELSPPTTAALTIDGIVHTIAEPCFPIQVAHGHVHALCHSSADIILLPAHINAETTDATVQSHFCPWGQTLPFVLSASPAAFNAGGRLLTPILHFREGAGRIEKELWGHFSQYAFSRHHHRLAVELGYAAMGLFRKSLQDAGATALQTLHARGESGLVLLGRSYSLFDSGLNLHLPEKLRSRFGVNLIPLDFLPLDSVVIDDLNDNMFWNSGRRILQGARYTAAYPHLHGLWFTHFKCGPDSYVKPLGQKGADKPLLIVQLDAHSNDAGLLTRCEAYLHSKGLLK